MGRRLATSILIAATVAFPAFFAPGMASAAPAPLTIALITSETGVAAPANLGAPGAFQARIALQNAHGGVHGHRLIGQVIDDQSNPTTVATAVQRAISNGDIGVVSVSALFFAGYKYAQQAGVPVTGAGYDGPEWGERPNTNMFAADTGSIDPSYPADTVMGTFLKSRGATNLGSYGYGISPSSTHSAEQNAESFKHVGGKVGVLDTSVPFGGVDFTGEALVAKQRRLDAVYGGVQNSSAFALVTAMKQAGVKLKAAVLPTGYEQDIVGTPAWQAIQGSYFITEFHPFQVPNAATQYMAAALQKYAHRSPKNFPTIDAYEGWLGADLMIEGLQRAGANPTHQSVIKALRGIKSYNGGGLLPININYSTVFGHLPPTVCSWFLQAAPQGFIAATQQPICGHVIPGTATSSGSS